MPAPRKRVSLMVLPKLRMLGSPVPMTGPIRNGPSKPSDECDSSSAGGSGGSAFSPAAGAGFSAADELAGGGAVADGAVCCGGGTGGNAADGGVEAFSLGG